MPDTITDRAVNVTMRRRAADETVSPLRAGDLPALQELGARLGAWTGAHLAELSAATPDLPVTDRAADVWTPLLAVADLAGGRWPDAGRKACQALQQAYSDAERVSGPTALLETIRSAFGSAERVSTADLVAATGIGDATKLAGLLRGYGIASRTLRLPTGAVLKGYRAADFTDAFARYTT